MRDKKKSYWTVFEKMTSEVEKRHKSTNFDQKNGRQIAKIAKIKMSEKMSAKSRTEAKLLAVSLS